MKRAIAIILALCVLCLTTGASWRTVLTNSVAAAGFTLYDENAGSVNGTTAIGNGSTTYYAGQGEYTPGANITVREIVVNMTKYAGSITGYTYTCEIYTVTGANNDLTTLIQSSTGVAGNDSWSATPVTFSFAGAALTGGVKYGIAFTTNAAVDASNYARLDRTAAGGLGGFTYGWQSSKAYGTFSTTDVKMQIWVE